MRRLEGNDGAAAVELGLLLPLLVMIAFGIIEFSTAYNRSQGMQAGVREAARYAASGDISDGDVEDRLEAVLQTDDAGSGFPAPGGTLDGDIEVTVEYFATKTDFDSETVMGSPGDRCQEDAYAVRVTGSVVDARTGDYGLSLPLFPNQPFELDHEAQAIFRCLG